MWMYICMSLAAAGPAEDVRADLLAEMASQRIPGASVAVVRDGEVVFSEALGVSDRNAGTPMTPETRMAIGSVGKTVTATLIGQLVEEGSLSYTDTLGELLPEVGPTYAQVTVHELLTHMSGVPRDFKRFDSFTGKKLFRKLRRSDAEFASGGGWSYSNTGFILLGEIIERQTGMSFAHAVEQRILEPAHMTGALTIEAGADPERASAYERPEGPPARLFPARYGAGNLVATAQDMAAYDIALASGSLLPLDAQALQWVPDAPTASVGMADGEMFSVGRGWWVGDWQDHRTVGHTGSIDGYNAVYERYPDDDVSLVVLTNAEYADLGPLLDILRVAYVEDDTIGSD